MNFETESYKFIIVFKDPSEQTKFVETMDNLEIPEEFIEQINNDIIKNKCDKRALVDILETAIFNETWAAFRKIYAEQVHSDLIKSKIAKIVKDRLNDEMHMIPNCAYYSIIEYENDDFCYEILKQLMKEVDFIYRAIGED